MDKRYTKRFWRVAVLATLLAMTVVMLGAWTRLKDAGLGCPDWPTCYGQLTVPQSATAISQAAKAFPGQVVVPQKAWPEMIHRYFAMSLGLLIFTLAVWSLIRRYSDTSQPVLVSMLLVGLVIFQALLGKWTVTWLLHPLVVMGHLLGGMSIAACLWWVALGAKRYRLEEVGRPVLKFLAVMGIAVVFGQIFLGGWTSANYASIICPEFPFCQGSLFPKFDFATAFNFSHPIGNNYQGGILDTTARVTLQMSHRYGAIITMVYIGLLSMLVLRLQKSSAFQAIGWGLLTVLSLQILLGVANIDTQLALPVAVAHNGVALLLLLTLVTLVHMLFKGGQRDRLFAY